MLVTCPECRTKISETAEICPRCGFTGFIDTNETHHGAAHYSPEMTRRREKEWENTVAGFWGCVILGIVVVVIVGVIAGIVHLFQYLFQYFFK